MPGIQCSDSSGTYCVLGQQQKILSSSSSWPFQISLQRTLFPQGELSVLQPDSSVLWNAGPCSLKIINQHITVNRLSSIAELPLRSYFVRSTYCVQYLFVTLSLAFVFRLFLKVRCGNVFLYKMSRVREAFHDIKLYCLQSSLKAT